MELPLRPPGRRLVVAILAVVLAGAVYLLGRPGPDTIAGYAYPVPSSAPGNTIEVLNGTETRGLARRGTRALRARGFDVVYYGNGEAVDSTRILLRQGEDALGARLVEALGTGIILFVGDSLRRVDATVLLGKDYRPSEELAL